jgi:hypothetical protein
MKDSKHWPMLLGLQDDVYARAVRREIETYLAALHSYPERVAQEPCISFEQHLFSLTMAAENATNSRHSE